MGIVHTAGFRPHVYRESPWYWPIASELARFDALARFPSAEELSALYAERNGALDLPPLRFVTTAKNRPRRRGAVALRELYEGRIVECGEVPTRRDDWHDLFNALAFLAFPRAKRALHERQYQLLRSRIAPLATRLPNARTREQDALALFDEGGLCVLAPARLRDALACGDGEALARASDHAEVWFVPFGHALYEHMVAGLPCPLATAYVIEWEEAHPTVRSLLSDLDARLAAALSRDSEFREPSGARGCSLMALTARHPGL